MGEKRRRAILPTKRDTTEKKSGADSLLKVDLTTGRDRGKKEFRESPEFFGHSTIMAISRFAFSYANRYFRYFDYRQLSVAGQ